MRSSPKLHNPFLCLHFLNILTTFLRTRVPLSPSHHLFQSFYPSIQTSPNSQKPSSFLNPKAPTLDWHRFRTAPSIDRTIATKLSSIKNYIYRTKLTNIVHCVISDNCFTQFVLMASIVYPIKVWLTSFFQCWSCLVRWQANCWMLLWTPRHGPSWCC